MSAPSPRHILVRGVNWLGDAVMTTSALHRLRERFPHARITLLTHEKLADLWLHHPSIDDVISFDSGQNAWGVARTVRAWHYNQGLLDVDFTSENDPRTPVGAVMRGCDELAEKLFTLVTRFGIGFHLFDLALILPNSHRAALELYLTRIPRRVGYARPWRTFLLTDPIPMRPGHQPTRKLSSREIHRRIRHSVANPPSSRIQNPESTLHQIHDYLHLVSTLGADPTPVAPLLVVNPDEIEATAAKFGITSTLDPPLLALCPGAEYGPAKRWPLDRFIAAAREIQKRTNCTWLLLGSKADAPLTTAIHSALMASSSSSFSSSSSAYSTASDAPRSPAPDAPHSFNLSGQTTLRELMALLKLCRVLLTNDTGPMHVAAALGTPVVVPFGSTSPELTGPLPLPTLNLNHSPNLNHPRTPHPLVTSEPGGGGSSPPRSHHVLRSTAPCSPCFLSTCPIDFRCMTGISVESVVEAVAQALH